MIRKSILKRLLSKQVALELFGYALIAISLYQFMGFWGISLVVGSVIVWALNS